MHEDDSFEEFVEGQHTWDTLVAVVVVLLIAVALVGGGYLLGLAS